MDYTNSLTQPPRGSVVVVGAGNIGSHFLPLLARIPTVASVTIVDHDSYDVSNLRSQNITPADVGRPKAIVQAARLRELNPSLRVTPIVDRIENAPLGALRAEALVGCLDSRHSRRLVNRIAWMLGAAFLDAGIQADGMFARIQIYRPMPDGACLECLWDDDDYASAQETFTCDGDRIEAAPTNASASLGALAAALQALELEKILAGDWNRVAVGQEVLIDSKFHRLLVTSFLHNPECRFDHRTIAAQPFPGSPETLTLADLFGGNGAIVRVEGQPFASGWACAACLTSASAFGLRDRLAGSVRCPACGKAMRAVGFQTLDRISADDAPSDLLAAPLSTLGFRDGDLFSRGGADGQAHFEITNPNRETP